MSKQRAFVKYTKQGAIIPGSLIVTTKGGYPKDGLYKEVTTDLCCDNPIQLFFAPFTVTNSAISIRFKCNGEIVGTYYSAFTSGDKAEMITALNNAFGIVGIFEDTSTKDISLTMTETQKNELCPNGTLSFEIFQD